MRVISTCKRSRSVSRKAYGRNKRLSYGAKRKFKHDGKSDVSV